MQITTTVNGVTHTDEVEPRLLLVHYVRENLGLTGTNIGCDTSSCGACTLHVNGESVKSCTMLAVQADGQELTTIEGLADGETLHPMQEAFRECHGLQCGYCTPGMIMSGYALLQKKPNPSEDEIVRSMNGNICRCGTYQRIIAAIKEGAKALQQGGK